MPENKPMQLRRRIAPSVPLRLNVKDDSGDELQRTFNLSLDFNAACFVQSAIGKSLLDGKTWEDTSPITISTMLYAAILAKHPEFDTHDEKTGNPTSEGIEVIRSLMDAGNAKQIQNALFDAFVATLPPERQVAIKQAREEAAAATKAAGGEVPNGPPAPAHPVADVSTMPAPAAAISAS